MSKKNLHTLKNWPLIKDQQFCNNSHRTLRNLLPHEVTIFIKFHEDWSKIVDFLLMSNFWTCAVFSYSDFKLLIKTFLIGIFLYVIVWAQSEFKVTIVIGSDFYGCVNFLTRLVSVYNDSISIFSRRRRRGGRRWY